MPNESPENPDIVDTEIIRENDSKMAAELNRVINSESIGGNAGTATIDGKMYPCAGVNGFVDPETGRITEFSNLRESEKLLKSSVGFLFRVAMVIDFKKQKGYAKIIELIERQKLSPRVKSMLEESIVTWNQKQVH